MSRRRELTPEALRQLTLDAEPWLSCDDCFRLLDEHVERLLAGAGSVSPAMGAHLAGCAACREEAESLLLLVAADRQLDPAESLRQLSGGR
jgi:hypothetical protein